MNKGDAESLRNITEFVEIATKTLYIKSIVMNCIDKRDAAFATAIIINFILSHIPNPYFTEVLLNSETTTKSVSNGSLYSRSGGIFTCREYG